MGVVGLEIEVWNVFLNGGKVVRTCERSWVVPLEGLEPPTRDLGRRRSILAELQGHLGGDRGARTPNLGVANAVLSQLSYIPTGGPSYQRVW